MPVEHYIFKCDLCGFGWEAYSSNRNAVVCKVCTRKGLTSTVSSKKKRSDAQKVGKTFGFDQSLAVDRPVRTPVPKRRFSEVDEAASEEDMEEDDDDIESEDDADDSTYAPAPEFNPSLRYSSSGKFTLTRAKKGVSTTKSSAWTGITASAKTARNTAAQFNGERADDHGHQHAPDYQGARSTTGMDFEWCHLIADSLGGSTSAANLCCGSFHANTAMLCLENVLRGKTWLEVKVEVELRSGTYVAEQIVYRVRKKSNISGPVSKKSRTEFEQTIDGLASGCTKLEGEALSGSLRKWLSANKLNRYA